VQDGNGHRTTYAYGSTNRLDSETDALGNTTRYGYDHAGNRTSILDANNHRISFDYDANNRLIGQLDARGNATAYAYDAVGNRISVRDANGNLTAYTYDADNRLSSQTDPLGYRISYEYDIVGNRIGRTDGNGNITTSAYDLEHRQISQLDAAGHTSTVGYDAVGNQILQSDANGNLTRYAYDANNRLVSSTDATGAVSQIGYDAVGNRTSQTDANGNITLFAYYANNRLASQTDALGHSTSYQYDGAGNRIDSVDANNHRTRYAYDAANRLTSQTDALEQITRYGYDAVGNRTSQTDANNHVTRYSYYADNRLASQTDALGQTTSFSYNALGALAQTRDARGNTRTNYFDADNRVVATVDALGYLVRNQYDANGNQTGQTRYANTVAPVAFSSAIWPGSAVAPAVTADAAHDQTIVLGYDQLNRQISRQDGEGNISHRRYDAVGNLTASIDANGNTTTFAYDQVNRLTRQTDALGHSTTLGYDAVGNRTTFTDGNGNHSLSSYDAVNQLVLQQAVDGAKTRFDYDAVGNLLTRTEAYGSSDAASTGYTYDAANHRITETDALGGVTTYAYDQVYNQISKTDALHNAILYEYDANNRLTKQTDALGFSARFGYDANGNLVSTTDGRNISHALVYDADNRQTSDTDGAGYSTVKQYDQNNNLIEQTRGGFTTRITYNRANFRSGVVDGNGYLTEYVTDAVGNVLQERKQIDAANTHYAVTNRYYDASNREIASLSAEGYLTTRSFDALGNLLTSSHYASRVAVPASGAPHAADGDLQYQQQYRYDAAGRVLSLIDTDGAVSTYQYDTRGNRIQSTAFAGTLLARTSSSSFDLLDRKVSDTDAIGKQTRYSYDAVGNLLQQIDGAGTAEARTTAYEYDANRQISKFTDATGALTLRSYDGNGNLIRETAAAGLPEQRTLQYSYDNNNQRILVVNLAFANQTTQTSYDAFGNRTLVQSQNGGDVTSQRFHYDANNNVDRSFDGSNVQTVYQYDGAGNLLETIEAAGNPTLERHTRYRYDDDNRLISVTDPLGADTTFTLDSQGNRIAVTDALGHATRLAYDSKGRVVTSQTASGIQTHNEYDLAGNLLATTLAQSNANGQTSDARTTTNRYDILGRRVASTDAEGYTSLASYDLFGNRISLQTGLYPLTPGDAGYDAGKAAHAKPELTRSSYDQLNREITSIDGEGNLSSISYDARGNRISLTQAAGTPDERTTLTRYDAADRVIQIQSAEGVVTEYQYQSAQLGKPSREIQKNRFGPDLVTQNQYDLNGRLIVQIKGGITTRHTFDALGNNLTSSTGIVDPHGVTREFDADGREIAERDGEGNRTEFGYDAVGNRVTIKDARGGVTTFWYDEENRVKATLDPEGYLTTFDWDIANNRVASHQFATRYSGTVDLAQPPVLAADVRDRTTLQAFDRNNRQIGSTSADGYRTQWALDGNGNRISETQHAGSAQQRQKTFTFDNNNRLTSQTDVDGSVTTNRYDGANNLISQTVQGAGGASDSKQTVYRYDRDNRRIAVTLDPNGLAISQSTRYDDLGNILESRDAENRATSYQYDSSGRPVSIKNAQGEILHSYVYDENSNVVSEDGRDGLKNYQYNKNNQRIRESLASTAVFSIASGYANSDSARTFTYDASGNLTQTIDANGHKSTNYYDLDQHLVANLDADNVLHEYEYDAFGQKTGERLYLTRLDGIAQNPAQRPTAPAGEVRQYRFEYDLLGRQTRKVYPQVQLTTLTDTDGNHPGASTALVTLDERARYDVWGNPVDTVALDGGRSLSWYDSLNRVTARVDANGYLTQFDYDGSGNVVARRVYETALALGNLSADTPPAAPAGAVHRTDYVYDVANRLIEERTPAVAVFDPTGRTSHDQVLINRYVYDKTGNQVQKISAFGTGGQQIETSYFDDRNQRIATIDASRVLTLFHYDNAGHLTSSVRFAQAVSSAVDLAQVAHTYAALVALTASSASDQATRSSYNARGQVIAQERALAGISLDANGQVTNLASVTRQSYQYDAAGNRTLIQDERGFQVKSEFDGLGRTTKVLQADGSGTRQYYDAAGNVIYSYTGELRNQASAATNISASLGNQLNINYQLGSTSLASYVVWDSVSHPNVGDYANKSNQSASLSSNRGQISIPRPTPGSTVYFRVVTLDVAGNSVYTSEQQVVLPPLVDDVQVTRPTPNSLQVKVFLGAGVSQTKLLYGPHGAANNEINLTDVGGGYYQASLAVAGDPGDLGFKLQWKSPQGTVFTSAEKSFQAPGDRVGSASYLREIVDDSGVHLQLNLSAPHTSNARLVTAKWHIANSNYGYGQTGAQGNDSYNLSLGDEVPLQPGQTYEIILSSVSDDGQETLISHFNYTVTGTDGQSASFNTIAWQAPPLGNSQLVIAQGQPIPAERTGEGNSHIVANTNGGSGSYDVYYGDLASSNHSSSATSSEWLVYVPGQGPTPLRDDGDPGDPGGYYELRGYNLSFNASFSGAEADQIPFGLHLSWRDSGVGTSFDHDSLFTATGNGQYRFDLNQIPLPVTSFDYKIWYQDSQGHEVIVDWSRVNSDSNDAHNGRSLIVAAREQGGSYSGANVSAGTYTGQLSSGDFINGIQLQVNDSGGSGGELDAILGTSGYANITRYNALNAKIGSTENDGVWREYGVDAAGHAVETDTYGVQGNTSHTTAYASFDALGHQTAQFGVAFTAQGASSAEHPVTRQSYDYQGQVATSTDALGHVSRTEYDALGRVTRQTDALGNSKQTAYDSAGHVAAVTDENGHTSYQQYNAGGFLSATIDATGVVVQQERDSFGRLSATIDGNGNRTDYRYDAQDRLLQQGNVSFDYDAHGNQIAQYDTGNPNGHRREATYDALGRITSITTTQRVGTSERRVTSERRYDVFGNLIAEIDGNGNSKQYIYGGFARLLQQIDQDGNRTNYRYDDLGRQIEESGDRGHDIRRSYDDAGHLIGITDLATGVSSQISYDIRGLRTEQIDSNGYDVEGHSHDRSVENQFDALGRLTHWRDSVTGLEETISYDAVGNQTRVQGSGGGTSVDHATEFDAANRVITLKNNGGVVGSYTYDAAGNRSTYRVGGNLTTYRYDRYNRPISAITELEPQIYTLGAVDTGYTLNVYGLNGVQSPARYSLTVREALQALALRQYGNVEQWTRIQSENQISDAELDGQADKLLGGRSLTLYQLKSITWQYDSAGNNTFYQETENGLVRKTVTKQFDNASKNYYSQTDELKNGLVPEGLGTAAVLQALRNHSGLAAFTPALEASGQTLTHELDAAGRISKTTLRTYGKSNKTFYYVYDYYGDGRERSIRSFGDASGNASLTYDANNKLVTLNQGKGDGQDRAEISYFNYDTAGHIVAKYHDSGKGNARERIDYVYAEGNPVAETGTRLTNGNPEHYTELDTENYALFQQLGSTFPSGSTTSYTVRSGDTLRSIADSIYGNAGLWYLIADANGLSSSATLNAGQVLSVPSNSNSGPINSETHKVYNESEIIGSKLPNLVSPPPPGGGGCGGFLQILVIVVAVVVTIYTAGAAAEFFAAAGGAGGSLAAGAAAVGANGAAATFAAGLTTLTTTTLSAAAIGAAAIGGAVGSIASQAVAIGVGLQDGFSWKQVGLSALGAGLSAGVGAATSGLGSTGSTFLDGAIRGGISNVSSQGLNIAFGQQSSFNWTGVAAAGIGGGVGASTSKFLSLNLGDGPAAQLVTTIGSGVASNIASQLVSTGSVNWRETAVGGVQALLSAAVNRIAPTGVGNVVASALAGAANAAFSGHDAISGAIGGATGSIVGQVGSYFANTSGLSPESLAAGAGILSTGLGAIASATGRAVAGSLGYDGGVAAGQSASAAGGSFANANGAFVRLARSPSGQTISNVRPVVNSAQGSAEQDGGNSQSGAEQFAGKVDKVVSETPVAQLESSSGDTTSSLSPESVVLGGYDPIALKRAGYPSYSRFFVAPLDRNGDPIVGVGLSTGDSEAANDVSATDVSSQTAEKPLRKGTVTAGEITFSKSGGRSIGPAEDGVRFVPNGAIKPTNYPIPDAFLPPDLRGLAKTAVYSFDDAGTTFLRLDGKDYSPPTPYYIPTRGELQKYYGEGTEAPSNGQAVTGTSLFGNFIRGIFDVAENLTVGTVLNTVDLAKAGGSIVFNEFGVRKAYNYVTNSNVPEYYADLNGPVAESYANGTSKLKLALASVPVVNLFVAGYDGIAALSDGDYNGFARQVGGLVGGLALDAGIYKYGNYSVQLATPKPGTLYSNPFLFPLRLVEPEPASLANPARVANASDADAVVNTGLAGGANSEVNFVDKSYKAKISGTAQRTGDDSAHQVRTYREAIELAKDPDVVSVDLDHGYNRALGLDPKTISPNRRPDVIALYNDGRVQPVEVQSATDNPAILMSRNAALAAQLRAEGYTPLPPKVVVPTRNPSP
jgi:YD repeat-containing protein